MFRATKLFIQRVAAKRSGHWKENRRVGASA